MSGVVLCAVVSGCNQDCEVHAVEGPIQLQQVSAWEAGGIANSRAFRVERTGQLWLAVCFGTSCDECCDDGEADTSAALALAADTGLVELPIEGDPDCPASFSDVITIRDFRPDATTAAQLSLACQQIERARADADRGDAFGQVLDTLEAATSRLRKQCGL